MGFEPALASLGRAIAGGAAQVTVASVDWATFKPVYEARRRRPILEHVSLGSAAPDSPDPAGGDVLRQLQAAEPESRSALLATHIRAVTARILGLEPRQVDPRKGLFDLGMDSLMSVDLKTQLQASLGRELPATLTFKYPTVAALAGFLEQELELNRVERADPRTSLPGIEGEDLTEDELAAQLASKLAQIR
jgi:myxalamid-type polyketide synthase MxaE and MxaD